MSKSSGFRFVRNALAGSAAALLLASFGLASPAGAVTLCPNQGIVGGFGETSSDVSGPLDGTCGANSAVQIGLTDSQDEGSLKFNSTTAGFPSLTLGSFVSAAGGGLSASANMSFTSGGTDQPYFFVVFTDSSDSLGQNAATDQILFLEFEPNALSGSTLALDPNSTLFNLYDNTTNTYLDGGQPDTKTLADWLTMFPSLDGETLQELEIAEGLTGSNTGAESMTINSVEMVPEPASLTLFGAALLGLGFIRRRRGKSA